MIPIPQLTYLSGLLLKSKCRLLRLFGLHRCPRQGAAGIASSQLAPRGARPGRCHGRCHGRRGRGAQGTAEVAQGQTAPGTTQQAPESR